MPVRSVTVYATPGLTFVDIPEIAGAEIILGVKREGLGYTDTYYTGFPDVPPVNRQFQYFSSLGRIQFDTNLPFNGTMFGRVNQLLSERVWVLYKSLV